MNSFLVLWENRFVGKWSPTGPVLTGDLLWIRPDHTKAFASTAHRFSAAEADGAALNLRARGCVGAMAIPADAAYDAWMYNNARLDDREVK